MKMSHELKIEIYSKHHLRFYVIKYRFVWKVFGLKIPLLWETLTYSVFFHPLISAPFRDQPIFFNSIDEGIGFVKKHGLEDKDNLDMFIKAQDELHKENVKRYYELMPEIKTHYVK